MENNIYIKFKENIYKNRLINDGDRVLLLCSLGKDSAVLTKLLKQLKNEIEFELIPILFMIPRHVYRSKKECEQLLKYWEKEGININVVDFEPYDFNWENRVDTKDDIPCDECRKIRNLEILSAIEKYKPDKIAAGFNLTDLHSYFTIMQLLSDFTLDAEKIKDEKTSKRFISLIPRHFMKTQSSFDRNLNWILPILIFDDQSISHYLDEMEIPYLRTKCKFKDNVSRSVFKEFVSKLHLTYQFESTYDNLLEFLIDKSQINIERYVNDEWIK